MLLALSPQTSDIVCLMRFCRYCSLVFPQFLGNACQVKGPVSLLFGLLHIVLPKTVFSFSTWTCFSLVIFLYDYPIPLPEFSVSENPDFS